MGDDINDIEVLSNVGHPFVVANADKKVKEKAEYISKRRGGDGAIREITGYIFETYIVNSSEN